MTAVITLLLTASLSAGEPDPKDPFLRDPDSSASTEAEMKPYKQQLRDTEIEFEMVPIPGGTFQMGSPPDEAGRDDDEGPVHPVKIEPFWMGKCEVTWDEYDTYRANLDIQRRNLSGRSADEVDNLADAVTRPTTEYTDMTFGSGHDGYPAICMTQLGAKMYCAWLTEKTGQYYRLPTEAEWEYACRAGTTTAYSFGDDPSQLDEYAWYYGNVDEDRQVNYQKVGLKKPNPWGLHDMHGNVMEWCLDQYVADAYKTFDPKVVTESPLVVPTQLYPRVVRGGSWTDDPEALRSANRVFSDPDWKIQDPQLPQSMWYHTDADFVGFRIIRPLTPPSEEQIKELVLYPDIPDELRKD
ncbi:MAG: formylglycine-generating enzyme family protein [Planctomycetaceae bacterium]